MPKAIKLYVRYVYAVNRVVGRFAMYMVFAMIALLLYSSISKTFFLPSIWTLEVAQFSMAAYYMLGGAYSMQLGAHVRMDIAYARWSPRVKAYVDSMTAFTLVFYLIMLLYGGLSSTQYALFYNETSPSAWAPRLAPIKIIMVIGITLMLLQAIAVFFTDVARARGKPIDDLHHSQESVV